MKTFFSNRQIDNIDNTLKNISLNKGIPKVVFILLIAVYVLVYFLTAVTARNQNVITLMNIKLPISSFTGVIASLGNICIIFMVVFFGKIGYITALITLFIQFPTILVQMLTIQNMSNIPGLFNNLLTALAITIIYINNLRINRYQNRMRNQAITDSLTGLPNRLACIELMNKLIKKKDRFAIVSVDIKNFKSINDTIGHDAGDKMLIEISKRWKDLADSRKTRTIDFVSRVGGDEFIIIIRGYSSCLEILSTINSFETELERKITIDDYDYFVTAFFGYAEYPDDAETSVALFSCADTSLHEAKKQNGSNRILRYNPDFMEAEQSIEIERKIRNALDTDSILFFLQPQYNSEHKLRGFEALARLRDIDGNFIRPDLFIPVAEKTGLIDKIDLQVFRKTARFLKNILNTKGENIPITMCINISVMHLMKNNFIEELKNVLQQCGLPANYFEIEITESIMIDSYKRAFNYISELKRMGFKIAIDDFGTGYSSLSYLSNFPANLLKIDKSFIDVMNHTESSRQYVATIISIGHVLNLEVISEGVESEDQLETLKKIGCDYIQGYIWGKPLPPEEAEKLLNE